MPQWCSTMLLNLQFLLFSAVLILTTNCTTAQAPAVKIHAYSRATLPGIREEVVDGSGAPQHIKTPFPPTYYVYVEVPKGTGVSLKKLWLQGKSYVANLKKVSTPVEIKSDPVVETGQKDTLVSKTANDVYAVFLGNESPDSLSAPEQELVKDNEVVMLLTVNESTCYGTLKTMTALKPAAAM